MDWKEQDLKAFAERGWGLQEPGRQVDQLRTGHQIRKVLEPCGVGKGIWQWTEVEHRQNADYAESELKAGREVALFIPASGAATRMFQDLHQPFDRSVAQRLVDSWKSLPFAESLNEPSGEGVVEQAQDLSDQILNRLQLEHLPKGEVPFFARSNGTFITAFEAHHEEWKQLNGTKLIFTVSDAFRDELALKYRSWEHVQWQVQRHQTDTLAWDVARKTLGREPNGSLIFRPGGHGALLENLNELPCNTGLIRNVDNALDAAAQATRVTWQRALLGALWQLEDERKVLWNELIREEPGAADSAWAWLSRFLLDADMPQNLEQWHFHLNRPIRVAGVVPNVGHPGGGPFWMQDADGFVRPNIAEKSELPAGLLETGTHFNPVDLAISLCGVNGERLDLSLFADARAYFTSEKVVQGTRLRILERPGLWNGAMAHWLTRFVELPGETFAPVKTLFDLCR